MRGDKGNLISLGKRLSETSFLKGVAKAMTCHHLPDYEDLYYLSDEDLEYMEYCYRQEEFAQECAEDNYLLQEPKLEKSRTGKVFGLRGNSNFKEMGPGGKREAKKNARKYQRRTDKMMTRSWVRDWRDKKAA